MNSEELRQLIDQGEGYYTEFKRKLSSDFKKELVAFANASGGKILLGIDDDGSIPGINITNSLFSQVQDAAQACDPPVHITCEKLTQNVLLVNVAEGKNKPYRCTSGFYLRVGANAQKLSTDAIAEIIEKEGRVHFDEQVRQDIDFNKHFSQSRWEQFAQLSEISKQQESLYVLKSLGAVKTIDNINYFTNAGVLSFSDEPKVFLPQASLTCVAYKDTNKVDILDRKEFTQDIISNINEAMAFTERHLNVSASIEDIKREDIWEIPKVALREAIVNAVLHRDYLVKGAHVVIEVFSDKLIISNPGGLAAGLNKNDFGKYSLTRNSILADILLRAKYIEKLGTGIHRIQDKLLKANLPKAIFEFNSFFSVTFMRETGGQTGGQIGGQIGGQKLTLRQRDVLNLIKENNHISRDELSKKLGINPSAVQKHTNKLKEKGYIKRQGGDRGYWEITEI